MGNKGKKTNKKKKKGGGKKSDDAAGAGDGTVPSAAAAAAEEEEALLLDELRSRARTLLASMKGAAPDGSPFAARGERHPLALLFESVSELTEKLISAQRRRLEKTDVLGDALDGNVEGGNERGSGAVTSSGMNRSDARVWDDFKGWLSLCNIEPKDRGFPVEIRKTPKGRSGFGLFATRDIDYGETIMEIPVPAMLCPYFDHCLMKDSRSLPPPFDPARPREEDQSLRPLCLIMFIVNERWKGARSAAGPYLKTLPTSYETPLYWSHDSILELQNTAHLKRAVSLRALTMWEYLQMRDLIKQTHAKEAERKGGAKMDLLPLESFDYESFLWGTAAAHTRQNLIPYFERSPCGDERKAAAASKSGDVQHAFALVPLWDMMNHEDSDRSCTSDVSIIDPEGANVADEAKSPRQGVLVCRTPMPPLPADSRAGGENDYPCFQKGEEIKMYYGDRSTAQLLFHSGFVNGGESAGGNFNRKDHTIIRVALPNAESEAGLDRIREMVAARFAFRAYGDQGVDHDGIQYASAAASILGGKHETNRGRTEVIMMDVSVSPQVACSDELKRALLLCLADKTELAHLLRNVEQYMTPKAVDNHADGSSNKGESVELLGLGKKHLDLVSRIVEMRKEKFELAKLGEASTCSKPCVEQSDIWMDREHAKELADDLSYCDQITLEAWFQKFCSQSF